MTINLLTLMMTVRSWASLFLLFCFGCALPPELQEAGDRFVYVFEGEPEASREDISSSSVMEDEEAPEAVMVEMKVEPKSPAASMASEKVSMESKASMTTRVPLSELDYSLDASALPSIYEQKPMAVKENSATPAPAYKVIKVGEEEIRVIDKDMGSVEKADLEILRTQVGK